MGTISFEHLKKNLLSGNYDKYHLPLFLRNSNINFMSYAWRYEFFFLSFSFNVDMFVCPSLFYLSMLFYLSFCRLFVHLAFFFSPNLSFSLPLSNFWKCALAFITCLVLSMMAAFESECSNKYSASLFAWSQGIFIWWSGDIFDCNKKINLYVSLMQVCMYPRNT